MSKGIKKSKVSRMNEGGAKIPTVMLAATLIFLGAGLLATGQAQVEDTARAPPIGYYSTLGPDGIPLQPVQDEPAPLLPSPKEFETSQGGVSGFVSGVSHV